MRARSHPRRRLAAVVAVLALLVAGCGSTASPSPDAPPGSAAPASGAGPAPSCPPIPPVAPEPTTTDQPGWWRGRVFYELFVRSFADSDGDGVGDLRGVIDRLDRLDDGLAASASDLGVTGMWLMPTFPSPSYHGYDVADYKGVNPDYGTLDDLRALVAEAHRRGIAVLLDLPLNHTSDEHPWFRASAKGDPRYRDWYRWADSPQGSNWHALGSRYYYGTFGPDLPDLNVENPDVTAALVDVADFWLGDVGLDGFRLDAAKHLVEEGATTENTPATHAWWKAFRAAVQARHPGALLLGEVYDTPQNSSSYVPDDLDLTFDFAIASADVGAAQSGYGDSLQRALARVTTLYPASGGFGAFLTNHDQDRIASQLTSDPAALRVAADLLLTGPGVPFIYYGEEIGMTGAKPDPRIRTPMRWDPSSPAAGFSTHEPWEALSDDPPAVNVATEAADPGSLLAHYRELIRLRGAHPALAVGTWTAVTSDASEVVAALRISPTETALVLTNVGPDPASPSLTLETGPLCGTPTAELVLGGADGAGSASPPVVTAAGGFAGYRPVASIPARSSVVIVLGR